MEIFVDGDPVELDVSDQASLGEALESIQSDRCAPGHLVVGLKCDEREIASNTMSDALQTPASSFGRLEVFTSTRSELVREAMRQAMNALNDVDAECAKVADLLSQGRAVEGIETLGECLGVWRQIHDAVSKSIQMLKINVETCEIDGESLSAIFPRPIEALTQIKEALTTQDYVLLADILQYELSGITQQWRSLAEYLVQQAGELDDE